MRRGTAVAIVALLLALAGAAFVALPGGDGETGDAGTDSDRVRDSGGDAVAGPTGGGAFVDAGRVTRGERSPRLRAAPGGDPAAVAGPDASAAPVGGEKPWVPPDDVPRREVRGVARTAAGVPVGGARVEVHDHRGQVLGEGVTGEDGSFRFEGVPTVKLRIVIAPLLRAGRATLGATVVPAAGGEPTAIVVPEGAVASGRVVGPDGLGVPDADIRWYAGSHRETLKGPVLATTDVWGAFEVPVQRDRTTGLLADPTTRGDSGLRWYYGYADAPAGGGAGIDIRCDAGFRVDGSVRDAAGVALAGVRLLFTASSAVFATYATSRADGSISCGGLPAGGLPVAVSVDPADTSRAGLVLSPSAITPRQSGPVAFVLYEPVTLRARVVDATNAPLADFTVWVGSPSIGDDRRVRTDADGRFALAGLAPGRYRVRVTWIPNHERERTHIVGEVEAGQPEVLLTYPEVFAR